MPFHTDVDLSTTLQTLAEENRKRRDNRRMVFWIGVFGGLFLLAAALVRAIEERRFPDLGSLAGPVILLTAAATFTRPHKEALKRIEEWANRQTAGYLLEAYATTDERDIREVGARALPVALADVKTAEDLDDYQRGLLYRLVSPKNHPQVVSAALACIRRTAGPEAIPFLEAFHRRAQRDRRTEWQRLAQEALMVLPDIRIRTARGIIEHRLQSTQRDADEQHRRLGFAPAEETEKPEIRT